MNTNPSFLNGNGVRFIQAGLWLLIGVLSACAAGVDPKWNEQLKIAPIPYEQRAKSHTEISRSGISALLNGFVLTRKDGLACAFRFTSFRREGEFVPESYFTMGGYKTFAQYEWHFQGDGSFDFNKPNVQSGNGQLQWGRITV